MNTKDDTIHIKKKIVSDNCKCKNRNCQNMIVADQKLKKAEMKKIPVACQQNKKNLWNTKIKG